MQSLNVSKEADIYSLAIIMWEVAERAHPFKREMQQKQVPAGFTQDFISTFVQEGKRPHVKDKAMEEGGWPSPYCALMKECWHDDQAKRPTAQEVLKRLREMSETIAPDACKILRKQYRDHSYKKRKKIFDVEGEKEVEKQGRQAGINPYLDEEDDSWFGKGNLASFLKHIYFCKDIDPKKILYAFRTSPGAPAEDTSSEFEELGAEVEQVASLSLVGASSPEDKREVSLLKSMVKAKEGKVEKEAEKNGGLGQPAQDIECATCEMQIKVAKNTVWTMRCEQCGVLLCKSCFSAGASSRALCSTCGSLVRLKEKMRLSRQSTMGVCSLAVASTLDCVWVGLENGRVVVYPLHKLDSASATWSSLDE